MGRRRQGNVHLPPRMAVRRGVYYWIPRIAGKQVWQRLSNRLDDALTEYHRLERLRNDDNPVQYKAVSDVPLHLFRKTRNGAKHRGIQFDIDLEHVRELYDNSGGRCAVTGIPFEFSYLRGERQPPWAPSLDRIDSKRGYVPGNVRVVCSSVNVAMGQWGERVLRRISDYMRRRMKTE